MRMLGVPERSLGGFWQTEYLKDTLRKLHINFSDLFLPGKWSNSWVLQSIIEVSSLESKRTLVVPERIFDSFWHNGCLKDTSRKLHINFHISTFLGNAPSPMCLQSVIMESKRTLEVPERSLGCFWHNGWPKDTSRKLHINFQFYTCPGSAPTPGFSRASSKCHPWGLRGRWWFLRGFLVVFDIMDASRIHQGSCISIFNSIPAWEVLQLLGSQEHHRSVIHGV
jgi:hypothetical protein